MNKSDLNIFTFMLAFIILILPVALVWYIVFRKLKKYITTSLNYCFLTFCTLIVLATYFAIMANLGLHYVNGPISELIVGPSYISFLFLCWPIIICYDYTHYNILYQTKKNITS